MIVLTEQQHIRDAAREDARVVVAALRAVRVVRQVVERERELP